VKNHETTKKVGDLLTSSLNDFKEKFKASEDDGMQMLLSADESYEDYKQKYLESLDVVVPNVTPVGQDIITTTMLMNFMEQGKDLIGMEFNADIVAQFKESINDVQIVVAVGPSCQQVKIGDKVKIRMSDFIRVKNPNSVHSQEEAQLPIEDIDGRSYMTMHERNLKFIYNK
tara:strand:- start:1081 stop:1596 length:516 start_codon:yes stop_codon:yes gene_type:complete